MYQLSESVSLRAGYEIIWIEGLALATDQTPSLGLLSRTGLNTTGGTLFHGATVGLEFRR